MPNPLHDNSMILGIAFLFSHKSRGGMLSYLCTNANHMPEKHPRALRINHSGAQVCICNFHLRDPWNAELFLYKPWRPMWNHYKCVSFIRFILIHMLWVYAIINIFNSFSAETFYTSESDVYRRQTLTYKVGLRTERIEVHGVKIINHNIQFLYLNFLIPANP